MKPEDILNLIEERSVSLRSSHNNGYLSFIGVIITLTSGLLGFKQDITDCTKYLLLIAILFLVVGLGFYFEESENLIKKNDKLYRIVAEAIDKKESDIKSKLDKNNERTSKEKFIAKAYVILENSGLILFLLGIISFIFGGK